MKHSIFTLTITNAISCQAVLHYVMICNAMLCNVILNRIELNRIKLDKATTGQDQVLKFNSYLDKSDNLLGNVCWKVDTCMKERVHQQ